MAKSKPVVNPNSTQLTCTVSSSVAFTAQKYALALSIAETLRVGPESRHVRICRSSAAKIKATIAEYDEYQKLSSDPDMEDFVEKLPMNDVSKFWTDLCARSSTLTPCQQLELTLLLGNDYDEFEMPDAFVPALLDLMIEHAPKMRDTLQAAKQSRAEQEDNRRALALADLKTKAAKLGMVLVPCGSTSPAASAPDSISNCITAGLIKMHASGAIGITDDRRRYTTPMAGTTLARKLVELDGRLKDVGLPVFTTHFARSVLLKHPK